MTTTISKTVTLQVHECGHCGITWAMPLDYLESRRKDGKTFYCPNGDARVYRETEAQKLEKALAAEVGNRRAAEERLDRERRSHSATKGKLTKVKKRASGGVCPCCSRSFVQLARHMKSQHPDYGAAG